MRTEKLLKRIDELGKRVAVLGEALFDVLDGNYAWYEIKDASGLSEKRCKEIEALFVGLKDEK